MKTYPTLNLLRYRFCAFHSVSLIIILLEMDNTLAMMVSLLLMQSFRGKIELRVDIILKFGDSLNPSNKVEETQPLMTPAEQMAYGLASSIMQSVGVK